MVGNLLGRGAAPFSDKAGASLVLASGVGEIDAKASSGTTVAIRCRAAVILTQIITVLRGGVVGGSFVLIFQICSNRAGL